MRPAAWLPLLLSLTASAAFARDNVLVIVADDLGVDGVGVYSRDDLYGHDGEGAAPGPTPRIDQLAAEGVLFRNAWTNPVCAPTRAEALTGRHGFRTGIGVPESAVLDTAETTLADLVAATHHTAAIGKWHLGAAGDGQHPIECGFDYYAGALGGAIDGYEDWTKTTSSTGGPTVTETHVSTYATTDAADEAIAKITQFGDDPWLVWLAFNAPHTPFHVPPEELTTIAVDDASDDATKWKAAVEAMDHEIGRVLDAIPTSVRADTTVIFLGDNGTPRGASESPFEPSHAKGSMYEGGVNVPFIVRSPRIAPEDAGTESEALVASVDLFATIADLVGVGSTAKDSLGIVPYLQDPTLPTRTVRPTVYAERFEPNGFGPYTAEEQAVRDARYKLIRRDGVDEELYDLDDDAFEEHNLLPLVDPSEEVQAAYEALVEAMDDVRAAGDAACPTRADAGCVTGFEKVGVDWRVKLGIADRAKLKLLKGPALEQTDFGDPLADGGTAYGVCLYDDADVLVAELRLTRAGDECRGKPCWKTLGDVPPNGKGYKYADKDGTAQGILGLVTKSGDPGKPKLTLKARGDALPDGVTAALAASAGVTVQVRGSDVGACLGATAAEVVHQDDERFTAR